MRSSAWHSRSGHCINLAATTRSCGDSRRTVVTSEHLRIAFESCCLSGKSTLIQELQEQYSGSVALKTIAEYTQWAGGHRAFWHMEPSQGLYPEEWEDYFIELDMQRQQAIREFESKNTSSVTLIDRTLLACIEIRNYVLGRPKSRRYENALARGECVVPDVIVLLSVSEKDFVRRLRAREAFPGWRVVFRRIEPQVFADLARTHYPEARLICFPSHAPILSSLVKKVGRVEREFR